MKVLSEMEVFRMEQKYEKENLVPEWLWKDEKMSVRNIKVQVEWNSLYSKGPSFPVTLVSTSSYKLGYVFAKKMTPELRKWARKVYKTSSPVKRGVNL
jgi:hypothetical protein